MKRKTFLASLAALFAAPALGKYNKDEEVKSSLPPKKEECPHTWYLSTGPERCSKCGQIRQH